MSTEEEYKKWMDVKKLVQADNFDPRLWVKYFPVAIQRGSRAIHDMRIVIGRQTMRAFTELKYNVMDQNDTLTTVTLSQDDCVYAAQNTRKYGGKHEYTHGKAKRFESTPVRVLRGDCIEAALWLKREVNGGRVAVLNMANQHTPGGGFHNGDGAQEENLHRRTNLFQCLENIGKLDKGRKWGYPMDEFGGIYTRDAVLIRGNEQNGYPYLLQPLKLDFVSVAAYARPTVINNRLSDDKAKGTAKKARAILNMALENECYNVVLSALGCGAFRNPPTHVAEIFKLVIKEEFDGCFENVIFAIYEDHNSKRNSEGNVLPFARVFEVEPIDFVYTYE